MVEPLGWRGIAVLLTGLLIAGCNNQVSNPPRAEASSAEEKEPEVVDNACPGKPYSCECKSQPDDELKGTFLGKEFEEIRYPGSVIDLEFGGPHVVESNDDYRQELFDYRLPLSFTAGFAQSCDRFEGITLRRTDRWMLPPSKVQHANSPPVVVYMWFAPGGNPERTPGYCYSEAFHLEGNDCTYQTEIYLRTAGPGDVTTYRIVVLNYFEDSPYVDQATGTYVRDFVFSAPPAR